MSPTRRAPDSRLVAIAILGALGRLILALALALGATHALWGYPPDPRRIYLALLASALLLGCSAYLIRDPHWLLPTVIWSGAVACVILLAAMAKGFLAHSPNMLRGRELYPGAGALAFFVFAVFYLRRRRR
jgi:hypothetical protein